ncbi:MAG: hypothetical protein RIE77_13345 [Phycisphaerales bacterium]|jgi:hypothetical protein
MSQIRTACGALGAASCLLVAIGCSGAGPNRADADLTQSESASPSAESLVGTWRVDLRPLPTSEPYYQPFVVESVGEKTFEGTFYGSAISEGRLNTDWGAVHFSFLTMDGSGAYLHAGVLRDGRLEGTTNSTGRDFLSVWTAERAEGGGS